MGRLKGVLKSRAVQSIFLTLIILVSLVLVNVQIASAVTLDLSLKTTMCKVTTNTITATIEIASGELVPITDILLTIGGPTPVSANFYVNGTEVDDSWSDEIVSVRFLGDFSYVYGDDRYGYGYGFDHISGVGNYTWNWGYGYGYGYGPITLTYEIKLDTREMTLGSYTAQLRANLESSSDYFLSLERAFTIKNCTGGSSGGGSGGVGGSETEPTETPVPTATTAVNPTPTPTPASTPTPTPAPTQVEVDLFGNTFTWNMSGNGSLQQDGDASSPSGNITVHIPAGVSMLGSDGQPLDGLTVSLIDPLPDPPEGGHVLAAFKFEPEGAEFTPGMQITIAFDPSQVAEGEDVVIAYYNEDTGEWEYITGVVNADGTATFTVNHLSIYGVLAIAQGAEPAATPVAASAHHDQDNGPDAWVWIVVAIFGLLLLVELIALILRLTRKGKSGGKAKLQKGKRSKKHRMDYDSEVRLQKGARPKKRL